jgi:hypothetical protein
MTTRTWEKRSKGYDEERRAARKRETGRQVGCCEGRKRPGGGEEAGLPWAAVAIGLLRERKKARGRERAG